jgi:hypothetical protein
MLDFHRRETQDVGPRPHGAMRELVGPVEFEAEVMLTHLDDSEG